MVLLIENRSSKIGLPYQKSESLGGLETRWWGWQFLNGLWKQRWQAGCWLHQCVLKNTLAGSKPWFLWAGTLLYHSCTHEPRNGAFYLSLPLSFNGRFLPRCCNTHICRYTCMYVYIYTYMYVNMCVCVCVYIYIYIYIYIYTCTYLYICIYFSLSFSLSLSLSFSFSFSLSLFVHDTQCVFVCLCSTRREIEAT